MRIGLIMGNDDRWKLTVAEAANTWDPILLVLRDKGYSVLADTKDSGDWYAVKEGRRFVASNLIALLGLVALWEHRGDDWFLKQDEPSLFDETIAASLKVNGKLGNEDDPNGIQ